MAQKHYIGKVTLHVAAPRSTDGFTLQEAVSQRFWQTVAPVLSDVFDRFSKTDELIRLDRLDINIDGLSLSDWEEGLPLSVYRAIEEALERLLNFPTAATALSEVGLERLTVEESLFAAWLFFLKTGQLPSTASAEANWQAATLAAVAGDAKTVDILRGVLQHNSVALERLVLQHNDGFLMALAEAMTGRKQTHLGALCQTFVAVLTHDFFIEMLKQTQPKHSVGLPSVTARMMEVLFWQKVFASFAEGIQTIDSEAFTGLILHDVFERFYKKDIVSLLSGIVAFEEISVQTEKKTTPKGAPKPSITSDSSFIKKIETKTLLVKGLALSFVQFIEKETSNGEIRQGFIAFFKKAIDSHNAAILDFVRENPSVVWLHATQSFGLTEQVPLPVANPQDTVDDSVLSTEQALLKPLEGLQKVSDGDVETQNIVDAAQKSDVMPQNIAEETQEAKENLSLESGDTFLDPETMIDETAQTPRDDINRADALQNEGITETDNPLEDEAQERELLDRLLPKGTSLMAPNAGVVLLHPFLKPMFESLDLLRGGKFVNIKAKRRSAALIHYLATGSEEMAEYDMALPKLLVGLPLHKPMDRHFELTELERTETDGLLGAVLSHWKALGSTTPDGLREGFLKRNGKLTHRSDGWLLQVEAKTLDILLDRLPWGFSMIRLGWMREMLIVEWH